MYHPQIWQCNCVYIIYQPQRCRMVIRVTALVVTGDVEACLQCFQWWSEQSSWQPSHFCASVCRSSVSQCKTGHGGAKCMRKCTALSQMRPNVCFQNYSILQLWHHIVKREWLPAVLDQLFHLNQYHHNWEQEIIENLDLFWWSNTCCSYR